MITYIPYAHFPKAAACLHSTDLQATRLAALEVLCQCILQRCKQDHYDLLPKAPTKAARDAAYKDPCVRMWLGNEFALVRYGLVMCLEWSSRGNQDNLLDHFATLQKEMVKHRLQQDNGGTPWWLYLPALSRSHQSLLMARRRDWYSAFWQTPSTYPTFWPVGPNLEPMPY